MNSVLKYLLMSVCVLFSMVSLNTVFSARLILPNATRQEDVNINNPQIDNWISNEWTIFEYNRIINSYLRFFIWWIAMAILIYAWLMMITAWWDKAKVGKAWKMALYTLIWVAVAMLSYLLVNLIVNLL